jgi:hypothetical protein
MVETMVAAMRNGDGVVVAVFAEYRIRTRRALERITRTASNGTTFLSSVIICLQRFFV